MQQEHSQQLSWPPGIPYKSLKRGPQVLTKLYSEMSVPENSHQMGLVLHSVSAGPEGPCTSVFANSGV